MEIACLFPVKKHLVGEGECWEQYLPCQVSHIQSDRAGNLKVLGRVTSNFFQAGENVLSLKRSACLPGSPSLLQQEFLQEAQDGLKVTVSCLEQTHSATKGSDPGWSC